MNLRVMLPITFAIVASCHNGDVKALNAAKEFQSTAEQCMLAVRDNRLIFEQAPSCKALKDKHRSYIDLRDLTTEAPIQEQLTLESGYRMAWGARAMSAAKDPTLSLWIN